MAAYLEKYILSPTNNKFCSNFAIKNKTKTRQKQDKNKINEIKGSSEKSKKRR